MHQRICGVRRRNGEENEEENVGIVGGAVLRCARCGALCRVQQFVACNNGEKGQSVDNNTGVTTPGDDDAQQGGETPDDEGQGGETPDDEQGGDCQDPAGPDEGEENPDEDINEPETPDEDEGGEENPPIEDEKDPFVIDTLDELLEYRQGTLYKVLNGKFMNKTIKKFTLLDNYTYEDTINVKWRILESSPTDISKLQVSFNLLRNDGYYFFVGEITFKEPISVQEFVNNGIAQNMIDNASYKRTYGANAIADQMEQNRPLAEAIVTELGGTLNDSDQLLVSMDNSSTDPEYSWVRNIRVKQITDKGVNEYRITISEENVTIENFLEQLQKNLEAGQYKNALVDENVVTFGDGVVIDGTQADVEVPKFEEQ